MRAAVPTESQDLWRVDITMCDNPEHGWLPRGWKIVAVNSTGRPDHEVSAVVTQLQVNVAIDPKAFDLEFPPGTWVRDFTRQSELGDTTQYIVLEGGEATPNHVQDRGATYQQSSRVRPGRATGSEETHRKWQARTLVKPRLWTKTDRAGPDGAARSWPAPHFLVHLKWEFLKRV